MTFAPEKNLLSSSNIKIPIAMTFAPEDMAQVAIWQVIVILVKHLLINFTLHWTILRHQLCYSTVTVINKS